MLTSDDKSHPEPEPTEQEYMPNITTPHASDTDSESELALSGNDNGSGSEPPEDHGNGGSDDDQDGPPPPGASFAAFAGRDLGATLRQLNDAVVTSTFRGATSVASDAYTQVLTWLGAIFKSVPAPVLVALISLFSTFSGARYKARRDKQAAVSAEAVAARKRKADIEQKLRRTYAELAAPILKSAAKMAERLYAMLDGDWDVVEKRNIYKGISPTYSAYLLGRYFATVEILKRESALLDYGFPAADRVLANILGRVQGVLGANDSVLMEMQRSEHLFKPGPGEKVLRGGPLRVTPRAQAVMGELLLRKLWIHKYKFVEEADEHNLKRGPKAVLSFLEFSRLMAEDRALRQWYQPLVDDFAELEGRVKKARGTRKRNDGIGARVCFLQNGLLDLVEFFDPLPHPQSIPLYRRQRLQLGQLMYGEDQRAPPSLRLLYGELANVRDHRVMAGNQADRLRLSGGKVEVHAKAASTEAASTMKLSKPGDCPYSQRVKIVLEELGIPYTTIYHAARSKPGWYYLLHPENVTPVVYHNGTLVADSSHIVSYLINLVRAPHATKLASADHLQLGVGTSGFTRFHTRFVRWMETGNGKEILERELRELDRVIEQAQRKNEGAPFLGGERFSREDTAIAPMLNNVDVAGREIMKWTIPKDCEALRKYLDAAREVDSFKKTAGSDQAIVDGYNEHKRYGQVRKLQLVDMLE